MPGELAIKSPYLLFLGDAPELAAAKTAAGLAYWCPDKVSGQYSLPGCGVDIGLPRLTPREAARKGVRTMIIGVASAGGALPESWFPAILEALEAGLDVAGGLHARLNAALPIKTVAARLGRELFDVRHSERSFPVGTGVKRSGSRILTVGTDCAVGKKYAALTITRELASRGIGVDFRATGQTGILISGRGVALDAVVADFVAGAAEWLSPAAAVDHWDVIEGQGSLFHPAYAGVSLALLHGSQPDALVVCHEPIRRTMVGFAYPIPDLLECIARNVEAGRLTNPACRAVGISINTSKMSEVAAAAACAEIEDRSGLPCADPVRYGLVRIVDRLLDDSGPRRASLALQA